MNLGFDTTLIFSTPLQWFAFTHLPDAHLPQSYAVTFFLNAHHADSLPAQLKVVRSLLLQAGSEGHPLISCAVTRKLSNNALALLAYILAYILEFGNP
jgi:hypothetical protein